MPVHSLINDCVSFVKQHRLFSKGDKILVAVSGGIDSVVLMDVLSNLREEWEINIAVAHFNHHLRGQESVDDEDFVRSLAADRQVPFFAESAETALVAQRERRSVQETARDLRYRFFDRQRKAEGFDRVATGHHADDNAETILFNLMRGAGVHGLAGIPVSGHDSVVIRPLLSATRRRIEEYARDRGLRFREDSSNNKRDYTRNLLRHEVIPVIREKINPNLTGTLTRTAELFRQLEEYLQTEEARTTRDVVIAESDEEIILNEETLRSLPLFLQEYTLRKNAKRMTHSDIDYGVVREMLKIADGETGSHCMLSSDISFSRDRGRLHIRRSTTPADFRYPIETGRTYEFSGFRFSSATVIQPQFSGDRNIEYVDAAELNSSLVLRNWKNGDWFMPFGLGKKKKVSDLLVDEKTPLHVKGSIPILESDGAIVWVCGMRLDDRWRVTSSTKTILKLTYEPLVAHS